MAIVQSVTGAIDTGQMGFTLIHEHLRVRSEGMAAQWPHLYDEEREFTRAVEQVRAAQQRGVQTIVDPTVMGLGRDIHFMLRVAEATGMQVLAATGLYTYNDIPFYFDHRPTEAMADLFVHDIEQGIQGTTIRAAFLKCATDVPGVTLGVERVLRAVAQAHRRTGAPIMTHSHPASGTGLMQQAILAAEGVDLTRVLIGHSGDTDNLDYLTQLMDLGSFIGMDRYGLELLLSTDQRNATIVELCRRGYTDRLMIAHNSCATIDWYEPGQVEAAAPNWTMTFIPDTVIPALLEAGLTDQQITTMTVQESAPFL